MELPCIVDKIIFKKDDGFAILGVSLNAYSSKYTVGLEEIVKKNTKPNKYNNFAITTVLDDPHEKIEGKQYIFIGEFVKHEKFGEQFKADFHYLEEPTTEDGLREYLMSLPNIKEARSAEIIRRFGVEGAINILDYDPSKLMEINGITEKRIPPIKEKWDREKRLRELYVWLVEHGVTPKLGKKIYNTWRDKSLEILTTNPYRLIEIKGVGFVMADDIAHKIFENVPKENRVAACIEFVLLEAVHKNSNLCVPYGAVRNSVEETLQKSNQKTNENGGLKEQMGLISKCIKDNLDRFVAVKNVQEENNGIYLYLKDIWEKEKYISEQLFHRSRSKHLEESRFACPDDAIEDAEKDISKFSNREIKLDDCQIEAVRSAFVNRVTVITGAGGTGKSMICRCICHLAQEHKMSLRLMSPTGKASQVLSEKTGLGAGTIHRSLKLKPGDDFPKENVQEDIIIVDEVSMVGIDTMFPIMVAMEENLWGNIIFVGDSNQLPSVSPGNFLSDIIASGCANVINLTKIHRQDENSYISLIANEIAKGKVVDIPENASDIKWHNLSDGIFEETIRSVVREFINRGNDINDLQILSPKYRGTCGVNTINETIQELMTSINGTESDILQRGFSKFYVGDRVLQTSNNYDKGIFNGDIGVIKEVGRKAINPDVSDELDDYMMITFYKEDLLYVGSEIEQLKLAWCITVHKYQGSQTPNVIFIMSEEAGMMMSKELVYTAITRAEKQLDIYGHMSCFKSAPMKSVIRKRHTNMNNIIKELRESRKILKVLE